MRVLDAARRLHSPGLFTRYKSSGFAFEGSKTATSFNDFRGISSPSRLRYSTFVDLVPSPAALGVGQQGWLFHHRLLSTNFLELRREQNHPWKLY